MIFALHRRWVRVTRVDIVAVKPITNGGVRTTKSVANLGHGQTFIYIEAL